MQDIRKMQTRKKHKEGAVMKLDMRKVDIIVLVVFLIIMIAFCFLMGCNTDLFFVVLGFAVAAVSAFAMYIQRKKDNNK